MGNALILHHISFLNLPSFSFWVWVIFLKIRNCFSGNYPDAFDLFFDFPFFWKSYSEVFIGITFTNLLVSMLIRFFLKIYINNEKVILFIFDNPTRQIELSEIFILLLGLCPYFPYSVLMIFLRFFSFSSSRYIHRKLIKYKTL